MYAEVQSVIRLSPDLVRVVLANGTLSDFTSTTATDAYINARFVPPGSPLEVPFEPSDLDDLPSEHRPRPRRFTIRRWDPVTETLEIDFVVHGDVGYAGRWARDAKPGDRLQFEGPGGSYRPSPDVDWHLLAGDESAFGAIGAGLEVLDPGERALVFAVVERPGHEVKFPSAGEVTISWLYRSASADPELLLVEAIANAAFPQGRFDSFVHGEAGEVRAVRRLLDGHPGHDVESASISAYWRRNHTDEDWRKVKREFMTAA